MKSIYRLKKNYQYSYVYRKATSIADKHITLLFCKSNNSITKVGFSVSKKHGNAVSRNRLRRQLKSAMSTIMPSVKAGYNIILIPRINTSCQYGALLDSITKLVAKAGLANE